jgi:hypothetical protein
MNSLCVLNVYRFNKMWVFDDPDVGLSREPFVCGVPESFDLILHKNPNLNTIRRVLEITADRKIKTCKVLNDYSHTQFN